jgi:hypothetical protein
MSCVLKVSLVFQICSAANPKNHIWYKLFTLGEMNILVWTTLSRLDRHSAHSKYLEHVF